MVKKRNLIWIIPLAILILFIIFFSVLRFSKPSCGDGICQEEEIEEGVSFCDIDCEDTCIQATGAINDTEEVCSVGWEATYLNLIDKGEIDSDFLKETNEIDFSNPSIRALAEELRQDTPKATAKATAKWVYLNINYDFSDVYSDCVSWKASEVLARGSGVCSTMSKLNIALLRANGIPAYSKTGCFKFNELCEFQQSFFGNPLPKFVEIFIDETGYAPTYGGLHNWVVVPLVEDGKIENSILESTSGVLYKDACINYRIYYSSPSDSKACGLSEFDSNLQDCRDWL